ncbi:MAG: hypothetical protein NTZ34_02210 [Chloroflexi bacterium]|nr:hypothetical protein [Chloroflexota bacterium]
MKMNKVDETQQNIVTLLKDGLPRQAFAIVEDPDCPSTWHLSHHTKEVMKAVPGSVSLERSVDWVLMAKAIVQLSRPGIDGNCVVSDRRLSLEAACHLASHYHKAGRRVPYALCICIVMYT